MSSSVPSAPVAKSIYLDQSVYSRILSQQGQWQSTPLGKLLLEARNSGQGHVWVSPTHVLETIQADDTTLRKRLAGMMLELIEGRRMWAGFEFELLDEYLRILEKLVPGAVRDRTYFEHYRETSQQIWLGALAMAAAVDAPWLAPVVDDLRLIKTMNQLIHARFAIDPDHWVSALQEAAGSLITTDASPLADLDRMTLGEMRSEIGQLSGKAAGLGTQATQKLNRDRTVIASVYGAFEIGALLDSIFRLPLDLDFTFDIPLLINHWDQQENLRTEPLPPYVQTIAEDQWSGNAEILSDVLQRTIRVAAKLHPPVLGIGYDVILREMQRNMNQKKLPTGGLTFDSDHASAINRHHVFMTFDEGLATALRAIVNRPSSETDYTRRATIVTNEKQLRDALR